MRYSLSFCDVYQISDDIFETIDKEGTEINNNCAEESWEFWDKLRKEPFGLLVNCKNSFSLSFNGARKIGCHPLQQKTALLVNNSNQKKQIDVVMKIKESVGHLYHHKVFSEREEAIKWLGLAENDQLIIK